MKYCLIFWYTHHESHDELPACENLPLRQNKHEVAPATLEYFPPGHTEHVPSPDRTVPGTHRVVGEAVG